jgi:predicted DNA-binding transcriptional regulator YafY
MLKRILSKAREAEITLKDINSIVAQYGFSESSIYFTPDIISQNGDGYNLLKDSGSSYSSILKSDPVKYLTNLQKSFIKSILSDKKICLFLEDHMLKELQDALADTPQLFNVDDIVFRETASDGDNFSAPAYISNFKKILMAIKSNRALIVCFNNSRGERKTMKLMPYKLEYGIRDDKFRLCGVSIYNEKGNSYVKLNLARILSITMPNQSFDFDFEAFIAAKRKAEPIEIEVYDFRNGFERVFIGLSNYERISSYHEETGKCIIKLYYTDDDEQELLIQLLSYGPAIKVLGPEGFREKFVDRIRKQHSMLKEPRD